MLTLRLACPTDLAAAALALFEADPTVSSLTIWRGASTKPAGDVIWADIPRESANDLVTKLTDLGVQKSGTIQLVPVATWISQSGLDAERSAPGSSSDAVVWAEVVERAYDDTQLTWTYLSFMILATLLAAIAIVTDSIVLVIGAMVLGPEFTAIATLGLSIIKRRPNLLRQALRTLLIGFAVSIGVVAALALAAKGFGFITEVDVLKPRPGTEFIYSPNWWSFLVAVVAGAAGVLSLTSSRTNGLVGVFISVTTIPASGNIAIALVFGLWHEVIGSAAQLGINIGGMAIAGWLTLLFQQAVWARFNSRLAKRERPPQSTH
ncbi:unannotated protein [freshwater metagenome]|uniref:Unannotated protein n=1 Tax=freshwater metagenome TaxID=449393 RepID=A0A6J7P7J9_9ZZZZ|nr:DUF389 domain-containing protein [Actinomycetota bacterium]MSY41942.1 DUF389 domain-containing protein [Actinomycetota bacterium]MSY98141.1 DUF389 domain-containing protein [Actinomycetota bacterium]